MTSSATLSWRALRNRLIVPMLALFSITVWAKTDSLMMEVEVVSVDRMRPEALADSRRPMSEIEVVSVDQVPSDVTAADNHCWPGAPPGARVGCGASLPEFRSGQLNLFVDSVSFREVAIEYRSIDITATGGIDYVAMEGTATIPAGSRTVAVPIEVIDDSAEEGHETFVIALTSSDRELVHNYVHIVILDDESIKVSVEGASEGEGHEGGMLVAVTLSEPVYWPWRVTVTTSAGTAGSSDYQHIQNELSAWHPPGSGPQTIPTTVTRGFTFRHRLIDDALDEANETYTVTVAGHDHISTDADSATMTILDDDDPPSASIASDTSGPEDSVGELSFVVTLDAPSGRSITLDYKTSDDTAIAGSDYEDTSGRLTFAPSEVRKTIGVAVISDEVHEPDETFAVTLSVPDSDVVTLAGGTAVGTIENDDSPPRSIALTASEDRIPEGAGATTVTVTATLAGSTRTEATEVAVSVSGSANADAVDFADVDDFTILIAAEQRSGSGTFTLLPEDDNVDESDETVAVEGSSDLPVTGTTIELTDDDAPSVHVLLSASPPRVSEGDGATDVEVTAMLDDSARTAATAISVSVSGTGHPGAVDFVPVADFGITIEANALSGTGTFTLTPVDDTEYEEDERLTLTAMSDLPVTSASVILENDDDPPALSVADAAGDEDVGALEFAVVLSGPSGVEVSAAYATADASATAGSDYAASTGTLVFEPGEVSKTIRVAILDDAVHEAADETFTLTLSALVNATSEDLSATCTIRDNDLAPPALSEQLPPAMLCVGGAPYELDLAHHFTGDEVAFSAVSSAPLVAAVRLEGSLLNVSPMSEGDASVSVTATNEAGSASGSITVRVVTDPAEPEAVDSVLASIGRGMLTSVAASVRDRFDSMPGSGEQGEKSASFGHIQVLANGKSGGVIGNPWSVPIQGGRSGGWAGGREAREGFGSQAPDDDWFDGTHSSHQRGMVPFSFSLDSAQSGSTGPAWAVWGRAETHRFESGHDASAHDGALDAVHLGADVRAGEWLAGLSAMRSTAQADYRFERSVDACGGGTGEGTVEADLTSVQPYVGRQIGRGLVWAALGIGSGDVSLERCGNGQRRKTDLSMRLAAFGGRHPFAGGEWMALSVIEEVGVLDLTTGDASGPIGTRSATVGQVRLGLEASAIAPANYESSLTMFVRAFARGDWGDGATGTGFELVAGVRYRNNPRRLGIDAGVRSLAVHSAENASEQSANLTFSILPRTDRTGWRASLSWRGGLSDPRVDTFKRHSAWNVPSANPPGVERAWIATSRLGYGFALRQSHATPFVELDAAHSERARARFGVRHEFGDHDRGFRLEWRIESGSPVSPSSTLFLEGVARF